LTFSDETPYSYEKCELFSISESADKPYQILFTDKNGLLAFVPGQNGTYQLKCFGEDGHGISLNIEIDPSQLLTTPTNSDSHDYHYAKVVLGLIVILALFLGIKFYKR
jgi:hypothetical protein